MSHLALLLSLLFQPVFTTGWTHNYATTLSWTYNVHGDVITETNPRSHVTTHAYDALGRRTRTTLPDNSEIAYGYDPAGNLTSETDARNFTTGYGYDGLNRRTAQSDPSDVGTTQTW